MPLSHPLVERRIGTLRREYLDRTRLWTTVDLETKLFDFQHFYNRRRTQAGLEGRLPEPGVDRSASPINFNSYRGGGTVEDCTRLQLPHNLLIRHGPA